MARQPVVFKQSDLTRAIKAARAAGLDVGRIEIEPGRIVVIPGKPRDDEPRSSWDDI
ncbi:hypothetical protein [Fulvimarina sp. MAC3]|uniref:hypothetical protein n=1 Tax=Fulvimarina sp. MAC3 TaxID=3148887 RepID=UPI0031FBB9C3